MTPANGGVLRRDVEHFELVADVLAVVAATAGIGSRASALMTYAGSQMGWHAGEG